MLVLGLTGSIAMGKSTAAGMLRRLGLPLFDADACVHALLAGRGADGRAAVAAVREVFPDALTDGAVDRRCLGRIVFDDSAALRQLEAILHPLVRRASQGFLARQARRRADLVVLDIPLLFEGGRQDDCDAVVLVTAPAFLQRQRALRRDGMTAERFAAILAQQMSDREKRRRADVIVQTGQGKALTLRRLRRIVTLLRDGWRPRRWRRPAWPPRRQPLRPSKESD